MAWVDGWKVDSATDSDGNCVRTEYFGGPEKMKEKLELKNMVMKGIEVEIGLLPKVTLLYS